jgi:hypothetical protein
MSARRPASRGADREQCVRGRPVGRFEDWAVSLPPSHSECVAGWDAAESGIAVAGSAACVCVRATPAAQPVCGPPDHRRYAFSRRCHTAAETSVRPTCRRASVYQPIARDSSRSRTSRAAAATGQADVRSGAFGSGCDPAATHRNDRGHEQEHEHHRNDPFQWPKVRCVADHGPHEREQHRYEHHDPDGPPWEHNASLHRQRLAWAEQTVTAHRSTPDG